MKILHTLALLAVSVLLMSCKSDQDRFLAEAMSQCKALGTPASDCKCRVRFIQDAYGKSGIGVMSKGHLPADFTRTAQRAALSCAGPDGLREQYGVAAGDEIAQQAMGTAAPAATAMAALPAPAVQPLLDAPASEAPANDEPAYTPLEGNVSQGPAADASDEPVFFCNTRTAKTILVEDLGHAIRYQYRNNAGASEIDISVPRAKVTTYQWNGMGRSMTYRINIPNANALYTVYWSAQRDPDAAQPVQAGVHAFINGQQVADVACEPGSVTQRLEGIDLAHSDM